MKLVSIQIQVLEEYRDRVKEMARKKGMSVQAYIRHLIAVEEEKERK